jgi:hypothetical protein
MDNLFNTKNTDQHGPTGSLQASTSPLPFVTMGVKLFVNFFLLVTTSSVTSFIPKDLKKLSFLSHLLLYVQVPLMLLTIKPSRKL